MAKKTLVEQNKDIQDRLHERLALLMMQRRLTPRTLAKRAGLPYTTVAKAVTEVRNPTLDTLVRLSCALDVPLGKLLVAPL